MFASVVTNIAGGMDADGRSKDLTVLYATSTAFSTHNKEQKETASFFLVQCYIIGDVGKQEENFFDYLKKSFG